MVHHASASRTAVWLVTTAPYQPALLPTDSIVHDYKNLWMKWLRLLCKPFGTSVRHAKGKVAFTLSSLSQCHTSVSCCWRLSLWVPTTNTGGDLYGCLESLLPFWECTAYAYTLWSQKCMKSSPVKSWYLDFLCHIRKQKFQFWLVTYTKW